MSIPREALDLIIQFEGYHRRLPDDRAAPYLCPARVATIGYGSVWLPLPAGGKRAVRMDDAPITRAEAAELLSWELRECEAAVDRLIARRLPALSRGALVSFAYNVGAGALRSSTLRRVVEAGQWPRVPGEFARWRMGGGVVLPGLVRRRAAEAALFLRGIHDDDTAGRAGAGDDRAGAGGDGWTARVVPAA